MKQTIKLLALMLMPILMISSCTDDEMPQNVVASSVSKNLSLSANYLSTDYTLGKTALNIKASAGVKWTFTDLPSWIKIEPISGEGNGQVTVYFGENSTVYKRDAIMYLRNTDPGWQALIELKVSQAANPSPSDPTDPTDPDDPENPPVYEGVDLGLSVLWATFNVGASSVYEYGNHYAWGETKTKNSYYWTNYEYSNGTQTSLTKYVGQDWTGYGNNGYYDNKYKLDKSDDVASAIWGDNWVMPDRDAFLELYNVCTWQEKTVNGVKGYQVTSKVPGYTNRSIFLPYAGYSDSLKLKERNVGGYYWSNTLDPDVFSSHAYYLGAESDEISTTYLADRYLGLSVRPVVPSSTWQGITTLTLDKATTSVRIATSTKLNAELWSGPIEYSFLSYQVEWTSDNPQIATVNKYGVVQGINTGSTTIRASYKGLKAACYVEVKSYTPVTDAVDLGLSVQWATCNIGAQSPEERGHYYAWGETSPKSSYSWTNYALCSGELTSLTKYCNNSSYGNVDNKTVLEDNEDVAKVLLQGDWRIPTTDEFLELVNNCTMSVETLNGQRGYRYTSTVSGYTDKSIFIPASGAMAGDNLVTDGVTYWSSNLYLGNPSGAYAFNYDGLTDQVLGGYVRMYGMPIRPVKGIPTPAPDFSTIYSYNEYAGQIQQSDDIIFSIDDYFDSKRQYSHDPRIIQDPLNSENLCMVICTNPSPGSSDESHLRMYIYGFSVGDKIKVSMSVRADKPQSSEGYLMNSNTMDYEYTFEGANFTKQWATYNVITPVIYEEFMCLELDLAKFSEGNNIYFDDVNVELYQDE